MVLHEKNVPFTFKPINLAKAEHKAPEYVEKQPFGVVPYIVRPFFFLSTAGLMIWSATENQDDDGFILFESRAICHYIVSKYPNQGTQGLIPSDLKANALYQQAVSIETSNFNDYVEKAVVEKVFKPYVIILGSGVQLC